MFYTRNWSLSEFRRDLLNHVPDYVEKYGIEKVSHNCVSYRSSLGDNAIGYRHHNTTIVVDYNDGTYRLDDGGYRSSTTKRKMNDILPRDIYVYQHDFTWFVTVKLGLLDQTYTFSRGMTIDVSGADINVCDIDGQPMHPID